jgi:molybdenum cofactor synthesis domain-containing protein
MVNAAIIIIGDEILSGSVQDANVGYLCTQLVSMGINVAQVRMVPDIEQEIIDNLRQVKNVYNYVFTTGGIGPTHDDITTKSIANLFQVPLTLNEKVANNLVKNKVGYAEKRIEAILKMAYFPEQARLIHIKSNDAPGYVMENIYVMAGIPSIMQEMFEAIKHELKGGPIIKAKTVFAPCGESLIAKDLEQLQLAYPQVMMGSYPFRRDEKYCTNLVLRSAHEEDLAEAYHKLKEMISKLSINS